MYKRWFPGEMFRCRVHPDAKGRYYLVVLFRTLKAMRKAFASMGYRWNHVKKALGVCENSTHVSFRKGSKARVHPCCGIVLLTKGYEGAGIATHEFTHAGLGFMRRNKRDLGKLNDCDSVTGYRISNSVEEELARVTGQMVCEFYTKLRRKHRILWGR